MLVIAAQRDDNRCHEDMALQLWAVGMLYCALPSFIWRDLD